MSSPIGWCVHVSAMRTRSAGLSDSMPIVPRTWAVEAPLENRAIQESKTTSSPRLAAHRQPTFRKPVIGHDEGWRFREAREGVDGSSRSCVTQRHGFRRPRRSRMPSPCGRMSPALRRLLVDARRGPRPPRAARGPTPVADVKKSDRPAAAGLRRIDPDTRPLNGLRRRPRLAQVREEGAVRIADRVTSILLLTPRPTDVAHAQLGAQAPLRAAPLIAVVTIRARSRDPARRGFAGCAAPRGRLRRPIAGGVDKEHRARAAGVPSGSPTGSVVVAGPAAIRSKPAGA